MYNYTMYLGKYIFTGDYHEVMKAWLEKAIELGYIENKDLNIK